MWFWLKASSISLPAFFGHPVSLTLTLGEGERSEKGVWGVWGGRSSPGPHRVPKLGPRKGVCWAGIPANTYNRLQPPASQPPSLLPTVPTLRHHIGRHLGQSDRTPSPQSHARAKSRSRSCSIEEANSTKKRRGGTSLGSEKPTKISRGKRKIRSRHKG